MYVWSTVRRMAIGSRQYVTMFVNEHVSSPTNNSVNPICVLHHNKVLLCKCRTVVVILNMWTLIDVKKYGSTDTNQRDYRPTNNPFQNTTNTPSKQSLYRILVPIDNINVLTHTAITPVEFSKNNNRTLRRLALGQSTFFFKYCVVSCLVCSCNLALVCLANVLNQCCTHVLSKTTQ